jgi:hypothetical protein
MKVGFATMEKVENRPLNSVGSSRIRARWYYKYWQEAEEYHVGGKYDVMVFQKAYWREMLESFEGIKIFDLCDPDWLEPRPVVESINLCHAAVTSTQALADYLKKFIKDKPIICIPDRVDLDEHKPKLKHEGTLKSVAWFGYAQNFHYLEKTFEFLIEKNIALTVISNVPPAMPMGYDRLRINTIDYNYKTLHEELIKYDAILMPDTTDDLKGTFKSNNKTLTAWALGLPVIKLPTDFDRFMSAEERQKEADLRLAEVREKWDVRLSVVEYKALIDQIRENLVKSQGK